MVKEKISVYSQSTLYVLAGFYHFINPDFYIRLMPDFFLYPDLMVAISGVAEIILGIALWKKQTRALAALGISLMLVVFLVMIHIPMLIRFSQENNPYLWIAIARIPLQFVLLYWAWIYTQFKRV